MAVVATRTNALSSNSLTGGRYGEKASPPRAAPLSLRKSRLENLVFMESILPEKKTLMVLYPSGSLVFAILLSGRFDLGQHVFKQDFNCHGVSAAIVGHEKLAVTLKFAIVERYWMIVIVTVKCNLKLVETETFGVFRVALGFLDFSNQSVVHIHLLLG
jgi:hypothetical protein